MTTPQVRDHAQGQARRRRPWFSLVRWLALAVAAFIVYENVATLSMFTHLGEIATLGEADQLAPAAPGCVELTEVVPGGPMAKVGAMPHDLLCPADSADALRFLQAGEPVTGRLERGGASRTVTVVAQAQAPDDPVATVLPPSTLVWLLANLGSALLGGLILWRSTRVSALLMGLSLLLFNWWFPHSTGWQNSEAFHAFSLSIYAEGLVLYCLAPVAIFAFGVAFYEEGGAGAGKAFPRLGAWWRRFLFVGAAVSLVATLLATRATLGLQSPGIALSVSAALKLLYLAAAVYLLYLGWRRAEADRRRRYALLLAGVSLAILDQVMTAAVAMLIGAYWVPDSAALNLAFGVMGSLGTVLIAYAILRHRVLELGLVVNRAVVYTILSLAILLAFGLLEYLAERFIHIEGREQNALFDIGLALGLYLGAHFLKSYVEKAVERLFFHTWHRNEQALRRYVKAAEAMTGADAVAASFMAELTRFTGGAAGALYLRPGDDGSVFQLAAGDLPGVPPGLDGNDRLLATLKTEGEAMEPAEVFSPLPAALALPMRQGSELTGFVLLGSKWNGDGYRADEREILAWAARHVGQELHALRVETLEQELRRRDETVRMLESVNRELKSVLGEKARTA